jgi:hypothetical protein
VLNAFGERADATKFIADCLARYKERIHRPIPQRPGLEAMLSFCEAKGLKKIVGTSSGREIRPCETVFSGIGGRFDSIVTAGDVERGKPAPDVFLKAAERAGETPQNCLVLRIPPTASLPRRPRESLHHFPDLLAPSPEIRAAAGAVLESLAEVSRVLASREWWPDPLLPVRDFGGGVDSPSAGRTVSAFAALVASRATTEWPGYASDGTASKSVNRPSGRVFLHIPKRSPFLHECWTVQ